MACWSIKRCKGGDKWLECQAGRIGYVGDMRLAVAWDLAAVER